jgi:hypothetical protein
MLSSTAAFNSGGGTPQSSTGRSAVPPMVAVGATMMEAAVFGSASVLDRWHAEANSRPMRDELPEGGLPGTPGSSYAPSMMSEWVERAVAGTAIDLMVGAAVAEALTPRMVTMVHFTNLQGAMQIERAGALRGGGIFGTYVTLPSEVAGLAAGQVEKGLVIDFGKGSFSTTFQTPPSNLAIPLNGLTTDAGKIQFQLFSPVQLPPGTFKRTQ